MTRLSVLGAGSWGTALAIALASRFQRVHLWARDPAQASAIAAARQNARYLPGLVLPANVDVSHDLLSCLESADIVLVVVPSAHLRHVLESAVPFLHARSLIVSATKGIEDHTLCRMSEVIRQVTGSRHPSPPVVLSGPTFAQEVAAGEPAAVVVASTDLDLAVRVQQAFSTSNLRFYATGDVVGVELGAALKNVIALGAGVCAGLGLGSNTVAALVTRGLAEISRLSVKLGGNPRTLSGLAGLGDLVLTATGRLSRNRSVGIKLGEGRPLHQILAETSMVAEGVTTCAAAHQLGLREQVELPITNEMYAVLYRGKDPRAAANELMRRPLTNE